MENNETINQIPEEETGVPQEENMPDSEVQEDAAHEDINNAPAEEEIPGGTPETPEGGAGTEEKKEW